MSNELYELDNVVVIHNNKDDGKFIFTTVIKMRPRIYDKHGCIIWKVKGSCLGFALNHLYPLVWNIGLEMDGEPVKKKMKVNKADGQQYVLEDAYEIKWKKIPPIKYLGEPPVKLFKDD